VESIAAMDKNKSIFPSKIILIESNFTLMRDLAFNDLSN